MVPSKVASILLAIVICPSVSYRKQVRKKLGLDRLAARTVPKGYLPVCAKEIVKETCDLLTGGLQKGDPDEIKQWIPIDSVKEWVSANEADMEELWKSLGLPPIPPAEALKQAAESADWAEIKDKLAQAGLSLEEKEDGEAEVAIACEQVCYAIRDYVKKEHVLPDASDLACREDGDKIVCDVDVRPGSLDALWKPGQNIHDMPQAEEGATIDAALSDGAVTGNETFTGPPDTKPAKEPRTLGTIDYAIWEVAANVAELFRFYPTRKLIPVQPESVEPALLETGQKNKSYRRLSSYPLTWSGEANAIQVGIKANGYVNKVLRQLHHSSSSKYLTEWFGVDNTATKTEITRVLNSVKHVLKNVKYYFKGPVCSKGVFAYVYPRGYQCDYSDRVPGGFGGVGNPKYCRKDQHGRFVYFLCDVYMSSDDGAKIETLVHEGAHHEVAYTDDVCADRNHVYGVTPMSTCQSKAYGRSACADLATHDKARALKNADNHCYFVQAVADPVYHEKQRCNPESNSVGAFADEAGDCRCRDDSPCYKGSSPGCPFSQGTHNKWFFSTCQDCKCKLPASIASMPKCHSTSMTPGAAPDKDGDCQCSADKVCMQGTTLKCPSSIGPSTKYFRSSCSNCACKDKSTPGAPALSQNCPAGAGALTSQSDNDGDCRCPSGTRCWKGRERCPRSGGYSSISYFLATCANCECKSNGSPPPAPLAGRCPSFAQSSSPNSKGDCQCRENEHCSRDGNRYSPSKCPRQDGTTSWNFFSSTCTGCRCITSSPSSPSPSGSPSPSPSPDSVSTLKMPIFGLFISASLLWAA